jgi:hypothetical protein
MEIFASKAIRHGCKKQIPLVSKLLFKKGGMIKMAYMKNLAIELQNAGIDYDLVNIEKVNHFQEDFHHHTGRKLSTSKAILMMYANKSTIKKIIAWKVLEELAKKIGKYESETYPNFCDRMKQEQPDKAKIADNMLNFGRYCLYRGDCRSKCCDEGRDHKIISILDEVKSC